MLRRLFAPRPAPVQSSHVPGTGLYVGSDADPLTRGLMASSHEGIASAAAIRAARL